MKPSDRYETPPEIFEELSLKYGPFDLDVCATDKTAKCKKFFGPDGKGNFFDAFFETWADSGSRAWMNPPYSNPAPWLAKAIEQSKFGITVFALLPADTSTKWFHDYVLNYPRCKYFFRRGRIRFLLDGVRQGSPKFGSLEVLYF